MKLDFAPVLKALSPSMIAKVVQTFDRFTLVIIGISWLVTIIIMLFALYTVNLAVSAKKEAEQALADEPALPVITRIPVGNSKEIQIMLERLQHRYPEVNVGWQNGGLIITGANGSRYHQWLMAIGQVDTLYPQYRWKIKEFCVGATCGDNKPLMGIDLVGEKVSFQMPQDNTK